MKSEDDAVAADDAEAPTPQDSAADAAEGGASVWVLCRRRGDGDLESLRAFEDESRARADLELVQSVADDQFWIARVPVIRAGGRPRGAALSPVQALALTWLADGAEAEGSVQLDDPVVISPKHVRGFLSVPPEEWRRMEEEGWVRRGMITPSGAAMVGRKRLPDDQR